MSSATGNAESESPKTFRGTEQEERAFSAFMQGAKEPPRTSAPPMDWVRVMNAVKAYNNAQTKSAAQ